MTTPHPRRRRKADDRIIVSGASDHAGMIRCDMILAPLDRLHSALDDKWGIDRLPFDTFSQHAAISQPLICFENDCAAH